MVPDGDKTQSDVLQVLFWSDGDGESLVNRSGVTTGDLARRENIRPFFFSTSGWHPSMMQQVSRQLGSISEFLEYSAVSLLLCSVRI